MNTLQRFAVGGALRNRLHRRLYNQPKTTLLAALLLSALSACQPDIQPIAAQDFDQATTCSLDGMSLADYPGPKAQVLYQGATHPEFFCDTVEMLNILKNPDEARRVKAVYTQDMGKADWQTPRGHWIDARSAFYVIGSKKHGAMGPTIASFAVRAEAEKFVAAEGGDVRSFDAVLANDVVLDGGALHDQHM